MTADGSIDPGTSGAIRRVGVVAKAGAAAGEVARELVDWLARRDLTVALDPESRRTLAREDPRAFELAELDLADPGDLVVVLGGDGTLLSVARSATPGVPLLGVNLGTLGFLTEVHRSELYPMLVRVLEGRFELEERALLDVELARAAGGRQRWRVLNDAVVTKEARARIIELTLRVDGHLVARFRSDGLILSTPTGSTAYNLSSGGPIVAPVLPVTVLTPICPHALTLRPLVVPSASHVEVTLETAGEHVYLSLDGQEGDHLDCGDRVAIRRARGTVRLVKVSGRTFYDSLRGKLRWGGLEEANSATVG